MILTSLLGSITGLAGGAITKIFEHKTKKLEYEIQKDKDAHEIELRKIDMQIMQAEASASERRIQIQADATTAVADAGTLAESFKMEPLRYAEGLVPSPKQATMLFLLDFIRGIIRPAMTLYLCGLSTWMAFKVYDVVGRMTPDVTAALQAWQDVREMVIYLTTTVILWWFGTRNKQAPPKTR